MQIADNHTLTGQLTNIHTVSMMVMVPGDIQDMKAIQFGQQLKLKLNT